MKTSGTFTAIQISLNQESGGIKNTVHIGCTADSIHGGEGGIMGQFAVKLVKTPLTPTPPTRPPHLRPTSSLSHLQACLPKKGSRPHDRCNTGCPSWQSLASSPPVLPISLGQASPHVGRNPSSIDQPKRAGAPPPPPLPLLRAANVLPSQNLQDSSAVCLVPAGTEGGSKLPATGPCPKAGTWGQPPKQWPFPPHSEKADKERHSRRNTHLDRLPWD